MDFPKLHSPRRLFSVNIYWIILSSLCVTLLLSVAAVNPARAEFLESFYALSLANIKQGRIWTMLTYVLCHRSFLSLSLSFFPLAFLSARLRQWYSPRELGAFFMFAAFSGALGHLLVAPETHRISGAFGTVFPFLILYCRFRGRETVFRFLGIPWNVNVLTLVAVTADLSSVQWSFRPDAGSFASHAAMLAFAYFYIRRDAGRSVRRAAARGAPREMEKKAWIKCPDGSVRPGKLIYSRMKNEDLFRDEDDHPSEHEIDRILDKISEKGLHSLTPEERRRLNRASRTRSRSS